MLISFRKILLERIPELHTRTMVLLYHKKYAYDEKYKIYMSYERKKYTSLVSYSYEVWHIIMIHNDDKINMIFLK